MPPAQPSSKRIIAIDGPAASGKSSVARMLARRLGFAYVNTGAMYRAATWLVLREGADPENSTAVVAAVEAATLACAVRDGESHFHVNGVDAEPFLRDDAINRSVSAVSRVPRVRAILVALQQNLVLADDLVMEGRDIGTVVFPTTPFKFYIDASPEVRHQRRAAQGQADEIALRDKADTQRAVSPLTRATDAEVIDSSHLSIEGVVDEILVCLQRKGLSVPA